MAHGEKIKFPDGSSRMYFCGEGQTWKQIIEESILPDWIGYCNHAWISVNHEDIYAPEKRVKWFLDKLGFLMSLDDPGEVQTPHKQMSVMVRELPLSECPSAVSDMVYAVRETLTADSRESGEWERLELLTEKVDAIAGRKPPEKKKWPETRFEKLQKIRKMWPGCEYNWIYINDDNSFSFGDKEYWISGELPQYQKEDSAEGEFANMSDVLVVSKKGWVMAMYDAACTKIDDSFLITDQ